MSAAAAAAAVLTDPTSKLLYAVQQAYRNSKVSEAEKNAGTDHRMHAC